MRPAATTLLEELVRLPPEELAKITRPGLSHATGLSAATVSRAMADLVAAGLVEVTYGTTRGAGPGCRWKGLRVLDAVGHEVRDLGGVR